MLHIESYAKINWFLDIIRRREDGYHDLSTLMQKVSLHDDLYFALGEAEPFECTFENGLHSSETILRVQGFEVCFCICAEEPLVTDENNTVIRALENFSVSNEAFQSLAPTRIHIFLRKRIPMQGGMGGGSSNAAAMLRLLNGYCKKSRITTLSEEKLQKIAVQIGADVPFCLHPRPVAYCEGIGERIYSVEEDWRNLPLILLFPDIKVSTPAAFRTFDETYKTTPFAASSSKIFIEKLRMGNFSALQDYGQNTFYQVLEMQDSRLRDIKNFLYESGAEYAQMSGSGATFFALYGSLEQAESAMQTIQFRCVDLPFAIRTEFAYTIDRNAVSCL